MKRMEALKGSCGTNPRSDGMEGAEVWFCFPYRPDAIAEIYDNNSDDPSIMKDNSCCNSYDQSVNNSSDDPNFNLTKGTCGKRCSPAFEPTYYLASPVFL